MKRFISETLGALLLAAGLVACGGGIESDNPAASAPTRLLTLGGLFSFDVRFDGDFADIANLNATQFNATLYNSTLSEFIGVAGSFAVFDLLPPANGQAGQLLVSGPNALATVSQIPEPSSMLLALAALALLGLVRHRRETAV